MDSTGSSSAWVVFSSSYCNRKRGEAKSQQVRARSRSRTAFRLTAQVFNLTNELNVVAVDTSRASESFGAPVAAEQGRIWQLGLEVRF